MISNERTEEWEQFYGVGWTADLWKTSSSYDSLLASNFAANIDKVASEGVDNFSVTFHRSTHSLVAPLLPYMYAGASKRTMG
jgi:hypothetical protein